MGGSGGNGAGDPRTIGVLPETMPVLEGDPVPEYSGPRCARCRFPVDRLGRTLQHPKKANKRHPCPNCGRFPKRKQAPHQLANLVRYEKGDPAAREAGAKGARKATLVKARRKDFLTARLEERADQRVDQILAPYFSGLELEPKKADGSDMAPSSKLEFYIAQSTLSEKILNRIEGTPVARSRRVDADDNDVPADATPAALARVAAAIVAMGGRRAEEVEACPDDVEEGEWDDGRDGSGEA